LVSGAARSATSPAVDVQSVPRFKQHRSRLSTGKGRQRNQHANTVDFAGSPCSAFIPKCRWLPFLVWCICGSRSPLLFLVELGAAISVASMAAPFLSGSPLAASVLLTVASICRLSWCSSSGGESAGCSRDPECARYPRVLRSRGTAASRTGPLPWPSQTGQPLLQEMNAHHGLVRKRRRPVLATGEAAAISAMSSRHGTTNSISSRNTALRVRQVLRFSPVLLVSAWLDCSATPALMPSGLHEVLNTIPKKARYSLHATSPECLMTNTPAKEGLHDPFWHVS
jgi:hypothetical protein